MTTTRSIFMITPDEHPGSGVALVKNHGLLLLDKLERLAQEVEQELAIQESERLVWNFELKSEGRFFYLFGSVSLCVIPPIMKEMGYVPESPAVLLPRNTMASIFIAEDKMGRLWQTPLSDMTKTELAKAITTELGKNRYEA